MKIFGHIKKNRYKRTFGLIFLAAFFTAVPVCAMQFGGFDVSMSDNETYSWEWYQWSGNEQTSVWYAEQERIRQEQYAREQAEREKVQQEQYAREQAEREKVQQEQYAREQAERERLQQEQYAREQAERERLQQEQYAREQAERERLQQEQYACEQAEREKIQQEQYARIQARQERQQQSVSGRIDDEALQERYIREQNTGVLREETGRTALTPSPIPSGTLTVTPSQTPVDRKITESLETKSDADFLKEDKQKKNLSDESAFDEKMEINFFHRTKVRRNDMPKIRIQAEGTVTILSLRVNHRECPWHWEGNYVAADAKIQEGDQVIELLAFDQNGNIACMEPWIFAV